MKTRRILCRTGVTFSAVLLACGTVFGATAQTKDFEGNAPNVGNCSSCQCEADWNPTVSCGAGPDDTIEDLLHCLITSLSTNCNPDHPFETEENTDPFGDGGGASDLEPDPPGDDDGCIVPGENGDYVIRPLKDPLIGFEILREDGSEIDNLSLWEDFPGIEWTELEVNQRDLLARIGDFQGIPTNGEVIVTLNRRDVRVDTGSHTQAFEVTRALVNAIERAGFTVSHEPPYALVTWDTLYNRGLTHVSLRSNDPGLVRSELALEPKEMTDLVIDGSIRGQ